MGELQIDVSSWQSILYMRGTLLHQRVLINVVFCAVNRLILTTHSAQCRMGFMLPLEVQSLDWMRQKLEVSLLGIIQSIEAFLLDKKAQDRGHLAALMGFTIRQDRNYFVIKSVPLMHELFMRCAVANFH